MSENSLIEWTHHTVNPWWGCAPVSDGCRHCYATRIGRRLRRRVEWRQDGYRQPASPKHWGEPFRWQKRAQRTGKRERVFCASMCDVFELPTVPARAEQLDGLRRDLWHVIEETPDLDWCLLTKRPENIRRMVPDSWMEGGWPPHAWPMTTVECQEVAKPRLDALAALPTHVTGVSLEPLLGPVDLRPWMWAGGRASGPMDPPLYEYEPTGFPAWVIVGGETGAYARPISDRWVRDICDQVERANQDAHAECRVAFFFKSWGDNARGDKAGPLHGRELDGRTWDEVPVTPTPLFRRHAGGVR